MSISYINAGAATLHNNLTSYVTPYPATVQAGDVAMKIIRFYSSSPMGLASGYGNTFTHDDASSGQAQISFRKCDGTEGGTSSTSTTASAAYGLSIILIFRGVTLDTSNVWSNGQADSNSTPSTTMTGLYLDGRQIPDAMGLRIYTGNKLGNSTISATAMPTWTQITGIYATDASNHTICIFVDKKDSIGQEATATKTFNLALSHVEFTMALIPIPTKDYLSSLTNF